MIPCGIIGTNAVIASSRPTISTARRRQIVAEYAYVYDDGDNMITKVHPFEDGFDDGDYSGWTVGAGTWTAANGYLSDTSVTASNDRVWKSDFTNDDHHSFFSIRKQVTGQPEHLYYYIRFVDWNNFLRADLFSDGSARLYQVSGGTGSDLDTASGLTVTQGTWYDVAVFADGADIEIWRDRE